MKELKATDKVAQKMTRDGAVAENLATGEVTSISDREPETDLSGGKEPVATAGGRGGAHLPGGSKTVRKDAGKGGDGDHPGRIGCKAAPFLPVCNSPTRKGLIPIYRNTSGTLTGRRISWTRRRMPSPQGRF